MLGMEAWASYFQGGLGDIPPGTSGPFQDWLDEIPPHIAQYPFEMASQRGIAHVLPCFCMVSRKYRRDTFLVGRLSHLKCHSRARGFAPNFGRLIFIHLQCWEVLPFCCFQRQRCIKVRVLRAQDFHTPLALKTAKGQHLPALEVYKNQSPKIWPCWDMACSRGLPLRQSRGGAHYRATKSMEPPRGP